METLTNWWNRIFNYNFPNYIPNFASHEELKYAIKNGNLDSIRRLVLEQDITPEELQSNVHDGCPSLLEMAVEHNHIGIVQFLVEYGVKLKHYSYSPKTMLSIAILNRNEEMIGYLIRNGVNLNQICIRGRDIRTNLELAIITSQPNIFQYLIDVNASIRSHNGTPNLFGSQIGLRELWVVKILISNFGVDYQFPDETYDRPYATPLMKAIKFGLLETVQLLINKGANVNQRNSRGETPLMVAIKNDQFHVVKYLTSLKLKIDYNLRNQDGEMVIEMPMDETMKKIILNGIIKDSTLRLRFNRSSFVALLPNDILNIVVNYI